MMYKSFISKKYNVAVAAPTTCIPGTFIEKGKVTHILMGNNHHNLHKSKGAFSLFGL